MDHGYCMHLSRCDWIGMSWERVPPGNVRVTWLNHQDDYYIYLGHMTGDGANGIEDPILIRYPRLGSGSSWELQPVEIFLKWYDFCGWAEVRQASHRRESRQNVHRAFRDLLYPFSDLYGMDTAQFACRKTIWGGYGDFRRMSPRRKGQADPPSLNPHDVITQIKFAIRHRAYYWNEPGPFRGAHLRRERLPDRWYAHFEDWWHRKMWKNPRNYRPKPLPEVGQSVDSITRAQYAANTQKQGVSYGQESNCDRQKEGGREAREKRETICEGGGEADQG